MRERLTMDMGNITTMVIIMATIYRMAALNHNRSLGRASEFEHFLAEIFRQAGWRVDRQPKLADGQPDLVAQRGGKKYVFELKVSSEGRKDRAVPLISQAILEVQLAARRFPGAAIPVAVIAADHISNAVLRDTLAALEQLPDALVRFRKTLPLRAHSTLPVLELSVRKTLDPLEAYNMVPGRDPHNC